MGFDNGLMDVGSFSRHFEALVGLYDVETVRDHLLPLAVELAKDPISEVRLIAVRNVSGHRMVRSMR